MKSRLYEKLMLRSQLVQLEEAEFRELDEQYALQFARDFREESLLLSPKSELQEANKSNKKNSDDSVLKKLHRALARETHPDITGKNKIFIEVQQAYENGDACKLIAIANEIQVQVKLSERDIRELLTQLEEKEKSLADLKLQVRWVWGVSQKTESLRRQIRRSMGISDEAWKNHLATKAS